MCRLVDEEFDRFIICIVAILFSVFTCIYGGVLGASPDPGLSTEYSKITPPRVRTCIPSDALFSQIPPPNADPTFATSLFFSFAARTLFIAFVFLILTTLSTE